MLTFPLQNEFFSLVGEIVSNFMAFPILVFKTQYKCDFGANVYGLFHCNKTRYSTMMQSIQLTKN